MKWLKCVQSSKSCPALFPGAGLSPFLFQLSPVPNFHCSACSTSSALPLRISLNFPCMPWTTWNSAINQILEKSHVHIWAGLFKNCISCSKLASQEKLRITQNSPCVFCPKNSAFKSAVPQILHLAGGEEELVQCRFFPEIKILELSHCSQVKLWEKD